MARTGLSDETALQAPAITTPPVPRPRSRTLRFVSAFHGLLAFGNVVMLVSGSFFSLLGRKEFVFHPEGGDRFRFSGEMFTLPQFLAMLGTAMTVLWLWRALRSGNRREAGMAVVLGVLARLAESAVITAATSMLGFSAAVSVLLVAFAWPDLDDPQRDQIEARG